MSMLLNLLRVTPAELPTSKTAARWKRASAPRPPTRTDLDKTWDDISYLLTGASATQTTHPLVSLLFSGQLLDEAQDVGSGPTHYLTPTQVASLHQQLAAISPAELRVRFEPARMLAQGVYPINWAEGEDALAYVLAGYATLRQAYAAAVQGGEGLLTWLS
jgi:hypothetical protein